MPGLVTIAYVYSYAIFRFTLEYLRDDSRGYFVETLSISTSQGIALLSILLLSVYIIMLRSGLLPKPEMSEIPSR